MKNTNTKNSRFNKQVAKHGVKYAEVLQRLMTAIIIPVLWIFIIQTGSALAQSNVVIDGMPVGPHPLAIEVNPLTDKVYVAGYSSGVTVIDPAAKTMKKVFLGRGVRTMAINTKANKIFVASPWTAKGAPAATLTVIDGADDLAKPIFGFVWYRCRSVGFDIAAYNPVTNKVYVLYQACGWNGHELIEVDGSSGKAQTIARGWYVPAAAVNTVTNKIFITGFGNTVTVIDGTDRSTYTVRVGDMPQVIAVNEVTNKIYAGNTGSGDVTVIDGNIHWPQTVATGKAPLGIAVNTWTNRVYVANSGSNTVTVIDGSDNSTVTVPTGRDPRSIAVNEVTNKIYVGNCGSGDVTVINGKDNSTKTVAVGKTPVAIAVNPINHKVYVVNRDSDTINVIDGS